VLWKLRVWGAKAHRNACEYMVAVARQRWEEDGGENRWENYLTFCGLFAEAVKDVEKRVSEKPGGP
jgi:hypothetical protein